MNRLAVLGQPIAHSLSPAMHGAAFRALGIEREWSYEAIELSPEGFAAGVDELRRSGYVGANVTIPHKEAALELADEASAAADEIGAANTLSFTAGGVAAENTDAPGLIAALPSDPAGAAALVLGAGGAARAAIWALREAGADVSVHNRTALRGAAVAAELGVEHLERDGELPARRFDLIVNATSVGLAKGGPAASRPASGLKELGFGADAFSDRQVVVDLVYGATATELLAEASRAGATVVEGREVLVRQGAESFRIWTGLDPPLEPMRAATDSQPSS